MNYSQPLLNAIKNKGYSVADVAEALKISKSTLYRKISGDVNCGLSVKEADEIKKFLELTTSEADAIFFTSTIA